jgi:hypothetical protein
MSIPTYIENPKTKGSGIYACIPQIGICPSKCPDCFFQSGRSYLEPLAEHLPNIPSKRLCENRVVRVNDGNDSYFLSPVEIAHIIQTFPMCFFNTSVPKDLWKYQGENQAGHFVHIPYVLTVNPGIDTDKKFTKLDGKNLSLMFVRFRTNTWNLSLAKECVKYYSEREIPIILTFMAYFTELEAIPEDHLKNYVYRKRTSNEYYAITTEAWRNVMKNFEDNKWVHSCGKIEGEKGDTRCRFCGNCLREYFSAKERMTQWNQE